MSATIELNYPILEVLKPECTKGFWLFGSGNDNQIKVPEFDPDYLLFQVTNPPNGPLQFKALTEQKAGKRIPGGPYDRLAQVRRHCAGFTLVFPRQHTDAQSHTWDFLCSGTLVVVEGQRLAERIFRLAAVGVPLRRDSLARWLAGELAVKVGDILREELGNRSLADVREQNVLPPNWWEGKLAPCLEPFGLELTDLRTDWKSADALRAQEAESDQRERERLKEQVETEKRQRLEQSRRDKEHARFQAQLEEEEVDCKRELEMKGQASRDQLDRLAEEFKRRRLQEERKLREDQLAGEKKLQELQHEMEKGALDHELEMTALREKAARQRRQEAEGQQRSEKEAADKAVTQAQAEVRRVQEQLQQADRSHQAQIQSLGVLKEDLKKLFEGFTSEILTGLFQRNQTAAYNAASFITANGFSAQQLQAIGITTRLGFIERLQASAVQLRKNNLRRKRYSTRDIVTGPAKEVEIDTLFAGEKVDFEFTSPRSGYVTVINPGTSGKFWLHVPNAYCPKPRIEGCHAYQVPGPELLPEDQLQAAGLAYYEGGPAGWEYLVVIVSDEPLMDAKTVGRSREEAPLIDLSPEDLQGALDRLEQMGRDRWASGVAKFRVEGT